MNELDQQLMLMMNYDGGPWADAIWWYISKTYTWIPLYLTLLWYVFRACRPFQVNYKHFLLLVVCTALVVLLADQIASGILKPLVQRPRPSRPDSGISEFIHTVRNYRGGHYGFVSSHAANTCGIALWFHIMLRKFTTLTVLSVLTLVLVLWVMLNCYSRIYLGVHYPGDILGGLVVGVVSALVVAYLLYPLGKKLIKLPDDAIKGRSDIIKSE